MPNLLSTLTSAADKAGFSIDSRIIGSQEVNTKQLLAMANEVIQEVRDSYEWPQLTKEFSFSLADGQSLYEMPLDLNWHFVETHWNASDALRLRGPMSVAERRLRLTGDYQESTSQRFSVRGATQSNFEIFPPPTSGEAGEIIVFDYNSTRCVRPRTWQSGQSVSGGGFCWYNGNYYQATTAGNTGSTAPVHTSSTPTSDGGVDWEYYLGDYSEFLADTDLPVVGSKAWEYGVFERFAEVHSVSFTPRYENQLLQDQANSKPGKILHVGPQYQNQVIRVRAI